MCTKHQLHFDELHRDGSFASTYALSIPQRCTPNLAEKSSLRASKGTNRRTEVGALMEIVTNNRTASSITAATGHHAPTSGWWRPQDDPKPYRYIQRGQTMPALDGAQTLWTLIHELGPS